MNHKYQEIKYTFVIWCDHLDKIKALAYLERKMIQLIIADSLEVLHHPPCPCGGCCFAGGMTHTQK